MIRMLSIENRHCSYDTEERARRVAIREAGQFQRNGGINGHAEEAHGKTGHHRPEAALGVKPFPEDAKKKTTKIGGAR